jgi:hypothetical protein
MKQKQILKVINNYYLTMGLKTDHRTSYTVDNLTFENLITFVATKRRDSKTRH